MPDEGFAVMADCGTGGAGLSGTVGLLPSGGGFGGGTAPLSGRSGGAPDGGIGAPGGLGAEGGMIPEPATTTLEVSFFGACGGGCTDDSGMLTRTVSRLATGPSVFVGSVIRIVSLFPASS